MYRVTNVLFSIITMLLSVNVCFAQLPPAPQPYNIPDMPGGYQETQAETAAREACESVLANCVQRRDAAYALGETAIQSWNDLNGWIQTIEGLFDLYETEMNPEDVIAVMDYIDAANLQLWFCQAFNQGGNYAYNNAHLDLDNGMILYWGQPATSRKILGFFPYKYVPPVDPDYDLAQHCFGVGFNGFTDAKNSYQSAIDCSTTGIGFCLSALDLML